MQWSDEVNAGFSKAIASELYLPIDPDPQRPNVRDQENNPQSLLQRVRELVTIRKKYPALQASTPFEVLYAKAGKYPLVYKRASDDEEFLVVLSDRTNMATPKCQLMWKLKWRQANSHELCMVLMEYLPSKITGLR